ncbi:NADPH-dependent FMN reductase [Sphingomonas mesophila]|uniref:NADPH-dependent FMN reductase n=1 Tax=Sphingomonas mesophila TaxID=2303576 RepID=UPI000E56C8A1|nr:NAD(P)H-dependent oxidoreductase [Sphingomonas mesophila]
MKRFSIAIVCGSLRRDSINRKIARSMCALGGERLDCRIVEIGDLALFNQDLEGEPPEAWVRFRREIVAADGVLFVSPEYNRSIPGALKNALDVGSRPYGQSVWSKKPAAIVTASPGAIGGFGANHQIRQACVFLDMPVMQHPEAYLGQVKDEAFGADGLLVDGPLKELVGKLAAAFADWVELIDKNQSELA